jgi:F-type H+-transporting ATPase subunit epsilon
MTIQLKVLTPIAAVIDETVDEVVLPGFRGEMGVLPDHTAYLTRVTAGTLQYRIQGKPQFLAVRAGLAEVMGDVVTILTGEALGAEDVEAEEAAGKYREAQEALDAAMALGEGVAAQTENLNFYAALKAAVERGQPTVSH